MSDYGKYRARIMFQTCTRQLIKLHMIVSCRHLPDCCAAASGSQAGGKGVSLSAGAARA
ncbi:hypothetical protein L541_1150 [Bordetella hinzii CA90 BAL1384]|uniref:Uncharacterized protein n=1 Tax=Bordetella hinzii OH87 BAL007II TaxID=1331262 RepID=A0ABR4R3U2_9BORD|nr:hypothetical protein L544_0790 [Bordetella hinzii OH87 BAL007II]KCB27141.1 hypothetical protein L541_1150 [Bordetella hinzii CA90 BAL1384]KCB31789.1 hypothetical protein L543_0794 [Bordetella hinzii L60]KCB44108.1 hypothetical protein L539_0959 [Bordetella hinzii 5132]KCB48082.1 hypothetical protein L538_0829 [Bordetella hinzii 4161]KCB51745.1 hypothetical protein L537_1068 [Bordetella hinzii 1277]